MVPELDKLDGWLATREADVGGVRSGCAKKIVWADGAQKTAICVVYVHGFSATGEEIRPLPDMVAQALGANLYFTRLSGHGQDGAAMGRARATQWGADTDEALEIGAALGDEVIVIGCSTGCTLLTTALANDVPNAGLVKGIVHVSPNYGLRHWLAHMMLQLPGVRRWGPVLSGRERAFEVISPEHDAYWTTKYNTQAVFTMADAVRVALASPIERITTPSYFAFCETDQVVNPRKTRAVMARWGGPVEQDILVQGPEDDKMGHVMAGQVFSAQQTAPLAARIIAWVHRL